jgi:hypothetical protein
MKDGESRTFKSLGCYEDKFIRRDANYVAIPAESLLNGPRVAAAQPNTR